MINDIEDIFKELDAWVSSVGTGKYVPFDAIIPQPKFQILPIFGIQQVREELYKLVEIILQQPWVSAESSALEIGLGHFGSSHILWRQLFKKITTIEKNHTRVNRFSENTQKYYEKWILGDNKSHFIIGSSQDPISVEKVYNFCDPIDFLFIDGDHSYYAVLTDWLLYSPLVKKGGMVVFDDTALQTDNGKVPDFLTELKFGKFGKKYKINDIIFSNCVGISYYIVD